MSKNQHKGKKHKSSKIDKLKAKYKGIYKSWKKTHCPSLNADVHFNDTGWNHIINGRSKMQVERRLELLPLSKKLLKSKTNPTISYRKYHGKKTKYWVFKGNYDNVDLVAILIKPNIDFIYLSDFEEEDSIYK